MSVTRPPGGAKITIMGADRPERHGVKKELSTQDVPMAHKVIPVVPAISIADFVSQLRRFPEPVFSQVDTLRNFLRSAPVDPESLEKYLLWDRQHYTRNLIDKTALYELVAICWEVGQISAIHNHRDQNCWMAVPIGRLRVQNYRVLEQHIASGSCRIEPSDLLEMNPTSPVAVDPREPVHKVYNPREFNARAVSLHVYSRPFDTCVVYSAEQGTCGEIGLSYTSEYGVRKAYKQSVHAETR